jgi:hypothetical protein
MKKLISSFSIVLAVCLAIVSAVVAGWIFLSGERATVSPFVFTASASDARVRPPRTLSDYNQEELIDMLIKKWVAEAFYVIPDVNNIKARAASGAFLSEMSDAAVLSRWNAAVRPDLDVIVNNHGMQDVHVKTIVKNGDFYRVNFDVITWADGKKPTSRIIKGKIVDLNIKYQEGLKPNAESFLEQGDAAMAFYFKVMDIKTQEELEIGSSELVE